MGNDNTSDLQSALAEKGLTISITQEKGRCLVATRSFAPGEIVLVQEPYVSVLDAASINKRCDTCFQLSMNLKRCSACKLTWYCSSMCQRNGWKLHQYECKAIMFLKEEKQQILTPSLRLMLRLLIKRKLQNDEVIAKTTMDNYMLVEALPTHMLDVDEKQLVLYAQMANLVNMIKPSEEITIKEITQNFCRFACNAHTICDSELMPKGTGLYPIISIINHSCFPNAVLLFEGKNGFVRAVETIEEGSELTLSYVEIAANTYSRQKSLKEQYFFDCKCSRCLKLGTPEGLYEDSILEGFQCSNELCKGYLLHDPGNAKNLIWQSCGCKWNEDEMEKQVKKTDKVLKEASKFLSCGNVSEARHLYEQVEHLQTRLWHPYSVHLMRTRDTLLKICMELQDWREALKYCRLTLPAYERAYPSIYPLVGLQYYTCGKLEWFLENTVEALKFYSKAAEILAVTHGHNSEFVRELFDRIQEARAETSHLSASHDHYDRTTDINHGKEQARNDGTTRG
ncbi:histone-lysine N-methyltransferase ASHR1 isoform X1 [Cryptomeria japonica]|uniref:histone-lysine N-methyltransferase ASHR1 isoform X1 n=1 Tax=Cryptomeria japonica TaxID=3369 RepID=UPI0025AC83E9|nr:histone-lysine N-methyltransferase ASHR1 isoform X1 [Cryptomeria japonica]